MPLLHILPDHSPDVVGKHFQSVRILPECIFYDIASIHHLPLGHDGLQPVCNLRLFLQQAEKIGGIGIFADKTADKIQYADHFTLLSESSFRTVSGKHV